MEIHPLVQRLYAYSHYKLVERIVLRRCATRNLIHKTAISNLYGFVNSVVGRPYGFNFSSLISSFRAKSKSSLLQDRSNSTHAVEDNKCDTDKDEDVNKLLISTENKVAELESFHVATSKTYFCSELVAAALQTIGILPISLNAASFWPVI